MLLTLLIHLHFVLINATKTDWYVFLSKYVSGSDGVILFFTISGYVISSILIQKLELKKFFIRRVTRITPMAILWLVLPLIILYFKNDTEHFLDNLTGAIAALLNVFNFYSVLYGDRSGFGIYWTLSLEEQFYLLFPIFLLLVKNNHWRIILLILFSLSLNFLPYNIRPGFRAEGIFYGIIVYLAFNKIIIQNDFFKKVLVIFMLLALMIIPASLSSRLPDLLYYPITPFISAVLVFLASKNIGLIPFNNSKILDWVGTRSYGIYLTHLPVLAFSNTIFNKIGGLLNYDALRIIIAFAVCAILTELCYRYFESPIRNWGRKLSNKFI